MMHQYTLDKIQTLLPDLRRARLLALLDRSLRLLDWSRPGSAAFYASVGEAHMHLRAGVDALAQQNELKPHVVGVGHAHIDLALLWRLAHSREKAAHTFVTALIASLARADHRQIFLHQLAHRLGGEGGAACI